MSNIEDTIYHGAANRETSSQTGGANWRPLPLPEGSRLGDEGVDFVEWLRKTTQEAQIRGVWIHLSQAEMVEITRAEYGGPDTYKNRQEIGLLNRRINQEKITAGELLRCRIAPNSEEMGLILTAIDSHMPFEAMNLLKMHCDKRDWGKLVEKMTKVFRPSLENTTGGIVNETRRLLDDICDIGIKLTKIQGRRVEDGEEKENDEVIADFVFPPCIVTAIALSRSMANPLKDREHHSKGSKLVKEISFRYPNSKAGEIGYAEFHEVLRIINRTEAMIKPEKPVSVFEFTSFASRPPAKVVARSANAKAEDNCEIHPNAKVSHTNAECRQNEANPNYRLKFQKRHREEEPEKKGSKPKNDINQKVLFIEAEAESDLDEIYLMQDKKIRCDDMSGFGFTPNKNLRNVIQIPRRADPTASQLEHERLPLTFDGLMKWHEKDRKDPKGRHFLESSSDEEEEEYLSSSDCISVDSGELFRKTGIERWPPKPKASGSRLLERNEYGDYVNMIPACVEPSAVIIDSDEHYLQDMACLTMEVYGEDAKLFDQVTADHPTVFEWHDEHEVVPDDGWKVVHEEEQGEMSPAASSSENEYDAI